VELVRALAHQFFLPYLQSPVLIYQSNGDQKPSDEFEYVDSACESKLQYFLKELDLSAHGLGQNRGAILCLAISTVNTNLFFYFLFATIPFPAKKYA
jgi:hypothetical protein